MSLTTDNETKPGETVVDSNLDLTVLEEKKLAANIKRSAFDREFRIFVKQAQDTINARYKTSIELGTIRPELICVNRYLNIYNSMTPEEHYGYFETLYNRNRLAVLNCLKDDRWLRTGRLVVQFGEGIKGMAEKCRQIRIPLSDIFLIACELQEMAEKSLDGIDASFAKDAAGKDMIRPNILLLHLLRIFYHLNDSNDKTSLGVIITELEVLLDVPMEKRTVNSSTIASAVSKSASTPSANGSGFSGLFTMATSMMERMGYKPPDNIKAPTEDEVTNVINTVFNNDTTQNAIKSVFSSLQGCNNFGEAIQTVVKNVSDPTTLAAIQQSVIQTASDSANIPPPNFAALNTATTTTVNHQ